MGLSSSAEVLVRMLEVQEPEIWKWKFRGEPWICLGLFLGVGRKHSIKEWLIIGLSGRFFEAMHQLIRSNFMGYWFGIFAETHWIQHYINPVVIPRWSHVLLYLVQECQLLSPDRATFCCIRYRGGLGCVVLKWPQMGQDHIQLKCSTRFGGRGGFSFSFSCWIVCMCACMFTHAAGIFRGHRLNPPPQVITL